MRYISNGNGGTFLGNLDGVILMCKIYLRCHYLKTKFLNQLISYHLSCKFLVTKISFLNNGKLYPVICGNGRGQIRLKSINPPSCKIKGQKIVYNTKFRSFRFGIITLNINNYSSSKLFVFSNTGKENWKKE